MVRPPNDHRTVSEVDAELIDAAAAQSREATGRYVGDRETIERALWLHTHLENPDELLEDVETIDPTDLSN